MAIVYNNIYIYITAREIVSNQQPIETYWLMDITTMYVCVFICVFVCVCMCIGAKLLQNGKATPGGRDVRFSV